METAWQGELFRSRTRLQVALDPFRPKSQVDASFTVWAKATYYPYLTKVYVPHKAWRKLQPDMVATKKLSRKRKSQAQSQEDKERSIRRTKSKVRDFVLSNRFELFCTFTFKEDRYDVDKCRAKMSSWLNRQQKRRGKFSYLIVPELHDKCEDCVKAKAKVCSHKDAPKAIHFHALFKDYQGKLKHATSEKTGKLIFWHGKPVYNLVGYTLGHTTAQKIGDTAEDHAKVSSYVRKYITKDMPLFFGKNRYWHSQKLVMPKIEYNPSDWYLHTRPDKVYPNDNGITYLFLNNYVAPLPYRFELFKPQTIPGILEDIQQ